MATKTRVEAFDDVTERTTTIEVPVTPDEIQQAAAQTAGTTPALAAMDMGGNKVTGLGTTDFSSLLEAVNGQGVFDVLSFDGIFIAAFATAAALPAHTKVGNVLTATANGALSVDGASPNDNVVVIVQNESNQTHNGLAIVTDKGSATTPWIQTLTAGVTDAGGAVPTAGILEKGGLVGVKHGTANGGKWFRCTAAEGAVMGTDPFTFENMSEEDVGAIAVFILAMANQPTDGDTLTIGADVYEFVDMGVNAAINNDARVGVKVGAAAANTRANLINAINGVGTAVADGILRVGGGGAVLLEDGTEDIVAVESGTTVVCHPADTIGGDAHAANPSIVLGEGITDAADIWNCGNVNVNTLGGRPPSDLKRSPVKFTATAAMIANGHRIALPFTPYTFMVQIRNASGVIRGGGTASADAFVIAGDGINITFNGGANPDIQVADVVTFLAIG